VTERANGPATSNDAEGAAAGSARQAEERVVVRDSRKIDNGTAKAKPGGEPDASRTGAAAGPADPGEPAGTDPATADSAGVPEPAPGQERAPERAAAAGGGSDAAVDGSVDELISEGATGRGRGAVPNAPSQTGGKATGDTVASTEAAEVTEPETEESTPFAAELAALRSELDERIGDLQRITAEYANYRKRVERDRNAVIEQAAGAVLAALLPVLDDLDRAREHGDLVGPFGAVAEQLATTTGKFGLTPFGEKGDPFDPTRHEAVAHQTSPDVTEPTCVDVMRRGYLLGERLLRPALVAVADPE
jgi:molecular chaperone GrpE